MQSVYLFFTKSEQYQYIANIFAQRPFAYGYVLTQSVKQVMDISESTLYPVLRRLQKDGLLSTYDQPFSGRLRRYYALTDAGRDKLNEYRAEWKAYTLRVNSLLYGGNNDDVL